MFKHIIPSRFFWICVRPSLYSIKKTLIQRLVLVLYSWYSFSRLPCYHDSLTLLVVALILVLIRGFLVQFLQSMLLVRQLAQPCLPLDYVKMLSFYFDSLSILAYHDTSFWFFSNSSIFFS